MHLLDCAPSHAAVEAYIRTYHTTLVQINAYLNFRGVVPIGEDIEKGRIRYKIESDLGRCCQEKKKKKRGVRRAEIGERGKEGVGLQLHWLVLK